MNVQLNHPGDYIPQDAYLFFPEEKNIKNDQGVRLFFDGNMKYDETEHKQIATFKAYCEKQNYVIPEMWTDNMLLRFLYANAFKNEKMLNAVKEHTAWREQKIPATFTESVKAFLEKGILYIHGRDNKFRPIIVFRAYLIDAKTFDVDQMIDGLTYFFEYVIDNFLLPGQVENWVFITDLNGMGMSSIPYGPIKKLLSFLQNNYRGRLAVMYNVNTPTFITVPWKMAKAFLEESTVKKINFLKKQVPEPLFQIANHCQVEIKYGGTAPNLTYYWPPHIPSNTYFLKPEESKILISVDEYRSRYREGKLEQLKINRHIVEGMMSPVKTNDRSRSDSKDLSMSSPMKDIPIPILDAKKVGTQGQFHSAREASTKLENLESTPLIRSKSQDDIWLEEDYSDIMDENCQIHIKEPKVRQFRAYFLQKLEV